MKELKLEWSCLVKKLKQTIIYFAMFVIVHMNQCDRCSVGSTNFLFNLIVDGMVFLHVYKMVCCRARASVICVR